MKKILLLLLILLVTCCALASCGDEECEHYFISATCETPEICIKCGHTRAGLAEHIWKNANCFRAKTCAVCDITDGAPLAHIWSTKNCAQDAVCLTCGEQRASKEHTWNLAMCGEIQFCLECDYETGTLDHSWTGASCTLNGFCERCNKRGEDALGHDWIVTSCAIPKTCQRCKESSVEDLPHRWLYQGCDEQRICGFCSQKEGFEYGHSWIEATCTQAKHCENCSVSTGSVADHKWQEASCALAKHCTECDTTVGDPLGHDLTLIEITQPLCEQGKEIYFCNICFGKVEVGLNNAIYGYHICDADGNCSRCGKSYDTGKMTLASVLIENEYSIQCCGIFSSTETTASVYKPITSDDVGMPVVDLGGSLPTAKGYTNVVEFTYESSDGISFVCTAEIKVQGASSAGKPKKNFNIKLLRTDGSKHKVELCDGWGKENKYCMKANYIDYSQSRNVVSAKIFGEIVKSRNDELYDTPNGGAIDGFPILVYNNGEYQGIYTMNIPKDKWMFDMHDSDEKNQAIFMTTSWNNAVSFREISTNGFSLEYYSNEDSLIDNSNKWAYESMLDLIEFVYYNDGEDFKNGIHQYADIDKCIDSMIYTFFICADDNTSKNILWVTLDGKVWFSSMYDMDGTWGMRWNGNIEFNENTHPISALIDGKGLAPERKHSNLNLLWERIYVNYYDRVCQRYWELREEILTVENITAYFEEFFDAIPDVVREAEKKKWTSVPSQKIDHLEQILTFAEKRIAVMDKILI